MIYSVKYTKIACSLFHVITASRGVGYDWRTLLVVPSTSNARISLPGWSRYVSGARLDFLVGFRCKMVFDASTLWQVRGAMHTMSISSPLKDYTLPSTDITTLTKQRDDPLQDRCTRIHIHIYPILSRPRVRKMHFKEIFMRLATYVVWRRCTSLIFKKKNVLFETRCIVKATEQIQKRVLDNITFRSFILFIRLSNSIVTISAEIQWLRINTTRILCAKQKDTIELEKRTELHTCKYLERPFSIANRCIYLPRNVHSLWNAGKPSGSRNKNGTTGIDIELVNAYIWSYTKIIPAKTKAIRVGRGRRLVGWSGAG